MSATLSNSGGAIHVSDGTTTTSVVQGIAKAHLLMDQRGTHLGSAGDTGSSSFNVSSGSDDASGYLTVNFTNSMSNTEYTPVCSSHYNGQDGNKGNARFPKLTLF